MDFSSLFPSTDNLFKFLFLGGLIMILTAMIYPLQKSQEKEIEILSHNQQVAILNKESLTLRKNVLEIRTVLRAGIKTCESLRKSMHPGNPSNKQIRNKISNIQAEINSSVQELRNQNYELEKKIITINFNKQKIVLLQKYVKIYESYSRWFLCIGIPISTLGLFFWSLSTIKTERLKTRELNRP
jgi:uncharacterized protein (UPF0333 family)